MWLDARVAFSRMSEAFAVQMERFWIHGCVGRCSYNMAHAELLQDFGRRQALENLRLRRSPTGRVRSVRSLDEAVLTSRYNRVVRLPHPSGEAGSHKIGWPNSTVEGGF